MVEPLIVISVFLIYIICLFLIAQWVEHEHAKGRRWSNNPFVYSLSLAVYCTSWTFYGSVGKAATSGLLSLTMYLGPSVAILLWWTVLRKMVRIKNTHKITSIADFISARYDKSQGLAAIATLLAITGIMPYIALQLKSVFSTFAILTSSDRASAGWIGQRFDLIAVGLMIVFTLVFGVRRLAPTERHEGMVMALAVECLVKFVAFMAVGIFVTFFMYDGFNDIFRRLSESPFRDLMSIGGNERTPYLTWTSYMILSMSAILFLPRQFHIAVVENSSEDHIRTAMWLFPLYMLLISVFIFPVAAGGLLAGMKVSEADTFVLRLPLYHGNRWLALLTFLGGFSASTGMIIIASVTLATMLTNHLLLPFVRWVKFLSFLKKYLLECRWVAVAGVILLGYWFEREAAHSYTLVNIGLISFAAVLQFAPPVIGGLFWRKANKTGAISGLSAGFLIWLYTSLLPSFAKSGWLPASILENGPLGIGILKPENLFGLSGFDSISHTVFWSMFFNAGLLILGSLLFRQSEEEQRISEEFVRDLTAETGSDIHIYGEANMDCAEKKSAIEHLFAQYFRWPEAVSIAAGCLTEAGIEGRISITAAESIELRTSVEKKLAASIGAASAREAVNRGLPLSQEESRGLSEIYSKIIADLKVTPADLRRKIDYHKEKETILTLHSRELEETIREREEQIIERKKAEEALRESERRLSYIIDFLPDATLVIDREGRVIAWNKAIEAMTGVEAKDILGKSDYEYSIPFYGTRRPILIDLVGSPLERLEKDYVSIKRNSDGTLEGEAFIPGLKSGEFFFFGVAAPLYDHSGNIAGAIESIRDITERKKAEVELIKHRQHLEELVLERTVELADAKEKAESANKAKSMFLANMSHELRTPMNAILGYSQLMQRDFSLRPEQKDYLGIINKSGEHLLALINSVLELSKIEAGRIIPEPVTIDFITMLRDLETMFRIKTAARQLDLTIKGMEKAPRYVVTDETKLRQILINLIENAVKFTETGGVALIIDSQRGVADEIRLVIEVTDTGPGIAEDELHKVFRSFEQTASGRQSGKGTGLGLAISRDFARMMGGDITVDSRAGEGCTFRLEIIVKDGNAADIRSKFLKCHVIGLAKDQSVPRVLVADDKHEARTLLSRLLKETGFDVKEAANGLEAVEISSSWCPHLIWMDMRMPVMDGFEATRTIKSMETCQSTIIVALTASAMEEDRELILSAGCDDFVRKPYLEKQIFDIMERHLGLAYECEYVREEYTNLNPDPGSNWTACSATLPDDLKNGLHEALLRLNTPLISEIIEKIAELDVSTGEFFKTLADNMEYERLLELLEDMHDS